MSERLQIYSSKEDALFVTDTINNSGFWDGAFCLSALGGVFWGRLFVGGGVFCFNWKVG